MTPPKKNAECPQEPRIKILETQYESLVNHDKELNENLKELTKVVNLLCKRTSEVVPLFNYLKWVMGILVACFCVLTVIILIKVI